MCKVFEMIAKAATITTAAPQMPCYVCTSNEKMASVCPSLVFRAQIQNMRLHRQRKMPNLSLRHWCHYIELCISKWIQLFATALEIQFTTNGIRKYKYPLDVLGAPEHAECIHNYTLISLLLRECVCVLLFVVEYFVFFSLAIFRHHRCCWIWIFGVRALKDGVCLCDKIVYLFIVNASLLSLFHPKCDAIYRFHTGFAIAHLSRTNWMHSTPN